MIKDPRINCYYYGSFISNPHLPGMLVVGQKQVFYSYFPWFAFFSLPTIRRLIAEEELEFD